MSARAPIDRRSALRLVFAGAASLAVGGHAPYGQWGVYRRRFLLILTTREDPPSYDLGERVAAQLAERLPDSQARVSRAPTKARIASLLSTHQMDLALMRPDDAAALRDGVAPFAEYGPVPLHAIVAIGDYLLVCRDDFSARHAWLIADALTQGTGAPRPAPPPDPHVPPHPGAHAYFTGRAMPDPLPDAHDDEHAPESAAQR